jgi:hypothetical protein
MKAGQKLFASIAAAVTMACASAAPASAVPVGLASPLTGSTASASFVDVTLSFDPNGNAASNLTGWELYLSFVGLTPIDSSFTLGSIFAPYGTDAFELHGTCADGAPCSTPADPTSAQTYVSLASVAAPHLPQGPGTLFTLRFAIDPTASAWSLNVFGESAAPGDPCGVSSGLLWEHPVDSTCAVSPFAIVPAGTLADAGTALVGVSAVSVASVPEPSTLLMLSAGLVVLARRWRR